MNLLFTFFRLSLLVSFLQFITMKMQEGTVMRWIIHDLNEEELERNDGTENGVKVLGYYLFRLSEERCRSESEAV